MSDKIYSSAIAINTVGLIVQLILLVNVISVVIEPNNMGITALMLYIVGIIILFMALLNLKKHRQETLNTLELTLIFINQIALILISLYMMPIGLMYYIPLNTINTMLYLNYANILLAVFAFLKNRHRVNISFILWGLFIMIWGFNIFAW